MAQASNFSKSGTVRAEGRIVYKVGNQLGYSNNAGTPTVRVNGVTVAAVGVSGWQEPDIATYSSNVKVNS